MNRFLIPLLILLGSLLFSWHWNCNRKPEAPCFNQAAAVDVNSDSTSSSISDPAASTITSSLDSTASGVSAEAEVKTPTEKFLMEPLTVYFNSGKSGINRSAEINEWLAQAKKYLEQNPNEKLSVTGHTDSDGDDASNVSLSTRRATTVKGILVKDGFMDTTLEPSGKGEAEPVASNETEEGKAKNRRVTISLIK